MSLRICVTFSNDEAVIFPDGLRASEVDQVRDWTKGKIGSKQGFFEALSSEDNDALRALRLLNLRRKGGSQRFDDIEVEFDTYDAYFIDATGREIEPDLERDDDGDVVMKLLADGSLRPKVHKHEDGITERWIFTDTREVVPADLPTKRPTPGAKSMSLVTTPDTP